VVETNVPGAQIYVDGQPIGPSPADGWWEYAGYREFTAVAPGYEPLYKKVRFRPKWYQYPPLDLVAEVLWPFRIEDVRRVRLDLEPLRPVNQLDLLASADSLRARGMSLPPSTVPDRSRRPAAPTPAFPPIGSGPNADRPIPVPQNMAPGAFAPSTTWNLLPTPATAPPVAQPPLGPDTAPGRTPAAPSDRP
jgi:hypothetical protein